MTGAFSLDGGCTCRAIRYRMTSAPLFVHCCHCRPPGAPAVAEYYDRERYWPAASLERRRTMLAGKHHA